MNPTRREALFGGTAMGALLLLNGKLGLLGGGLGTGGGGSSAPTIQLWGGEASTQHPAHSIVAAFTNTDGTRLNNLVINSFDDGAGGSKYYIDEFNNVCCTSDSNLSAGTDTITVAGSADIGAFNQSFPINVSDATTFVPQGTIVINGVHVIAIDVASGVPPAGTVVGQLSVVGDPTFTNPVFSGPFEAAADYPSSQMFSVSSAGVVTTTAWLAAHPSYWAPPAGNPCFFATQNGVTYHNCVRILAYNSTATLPAIWQAVVGATYVTSTLAPTDLTCVVAQFYQENWTPGLLTPNGSIRFFMTDDQGGRFQVDGFQGLIGPFPIYVCGKLSPGTYNPIVQGLSTAAPWSSSTTQNMAAGMLTLTFPVTVIDGTPTPGCSITPNLTQSLDNCVNLNTVIMSPTVNGVTGTQTWALHQDDALRFTIDNSTGQVTNNAPLRWGQYSLILVCSDGTNNANVTVNFTVAERVGPSVSIAAGNPLVSGSTYPDLISFFNDVIAQGHVGTIINAPLAGAVATIEQHPSGAWVDQVTQGYLPFPVYLKGDPAAGDRINITFEDPRNMPSAAWLQPISVDIRMSNIRFRGTHGSGNAAMLIPSGNGKQRITLEDMELLDCDDSVRGGTPGGVLTMHRCLLRNSSVNSQAHNIYVADYGYAEITDSVSLHILVGGHAFKDRAKRSKIVNCKFMDLNQGTSSTALDISNGGLVLIANTVLHLGPNCQNQNGLNWDPETEQRRPSDVLLMDGVTMVNDSVDWRPPVQVSVYSRSTKANKPIIIQKNVTAYGVPNVQALDQTGGAQQFLIGLDISCTLTTTRPTALLEWVDPLTGAAPTYIPGGVYIAQADVHDQGRGLVQTLGGGDTITISSSGSPSGTVVAEFTLDTYGSGGNSSYSAWSEESISVVNIGGTFTTGDVLSLTFQSSEVNGGSPVVVSYTVPSGATMATVSDGLSRAIDANAVLSAAKIWGGFQNTSYMSIKGPNLLPLTVTPSVSGAMTETLTMEEAGVPYGQSYRVKYPPIVNPATWSIATYAAGANGVSQPAQGNITGLAIAAKAGDPFTGVLTTTATLATGVRQITVAVNGTTFDGSTAGVQKRKNFLITVNP